MSGRPGAGRRETNSRGQTMTEYALIISSIIVGLILLYQQAGTISQFLINQVVPLF